MYHVVQCGYECCEDFRKSFVGFTEWTGMTGDGREGKGDEGEGSGG